MTDKSMCRNISIGRMVEAKHAAVQADVPDRILLLTNTLDESPNGGRELLCKLNYESLRAIYAEDLVLFELAQSSPIGLIELYRSLRGYIDGLSPETMAKLLGRIREERITTVFIDGSNLGKAAKCIRKTFPGIKIVTFFHNVEAVFFWGAVKQNAGMRALAVCLANYIAERKSVHYSNRLIALSQRDSAMLQDVYGRPATDISAIVLKDSYCGRVNTTHSRQKEKYALFVGSVFYANLKGIQWYARHVAPALQIKTVVLGRGFERYKAELERHGNVEVIGGVDSVEPWYAEAAFVVAPIFGGSGMKTKVAEALMFGKVVVGTPEAFSGYENIVNRAGCVCETAEDFITAIEAVCSMQGLAFDPQLRDLYLQDFSCTAAMQRLKHIMTQGDSKHIMDHP